MSIGKGLLTTLFNTVSVDYLQTDGPSGKQSNGEIMFRITLPDSTSSTVVRAAGDVKLQDAVQSIARRKGLLVDAVDFYEVYDNRSEKVRCTQYSIACQH